MVKISPTHVMVPEFTYFFKWPTGDTDFEMHVLSQSNDEITEMHMCITKSNG
jgi:hypothetical protein